MSGVVKGHAHFVVSLAVVATFLRSLPHPLQSRWDDGRFVLDNPLAHEVSFASLAAIFGRTHFQAYHPLHLLSYWLDVPWTGAHPLALHATSLAVWTLAANVLLRVFAGLGLGPIAALLATLAFALHPIQVEAVAWASGRKDALAALFGFVAFAFHLRARSALDRDAWLARASFLCAALSKTSALPLPLVLWLADVLLRGRRPLEAAKMQLPSVAVAVLLAPLVVSTWQEHEMIRPEPGTLVAPLVRTANTLAHQLATAFWPDATSPMYSTRAVGGPSLSASALALAVVGALALFTYTKRRRALFTLASFLVLLAPVANAVPLYFPWQDRYLSLPLVALAFGFGATFEHWTRRGTPRGAPFVVSAAIVTALGARTVQYQGVWASEKRLWEHATSVHPDAYYAWLKLGEVRRESGDLEGAIRAYERLVVIEPNRRLGYAALCRARADHDERRFGLSPSRAESYARELYEVLDDAAALRALAARMLASGHLDALEVPLARALELEPFADDVLERAALLHARAGRPSVARFYLARMREPTRDPALRGLVSGRRTSTPTVVP